MAGTFQLTSVPESGERETTLRERFEKWLQTYNISYGGQEEWMKRFEIYKSNVQYIDSHNSLDLPYKLTDNRFADMTHDEFNARYLGGLKTPKVDDDEAVESDEMNQTNLLGCKSRD